MSIISFVIDCWRILLYSSCNNETNSIAFSVAFCYYLATVHTIIETEDDYEKLFFVIDDPISSMDFNYVYRVAQSIRHINKHFGIESRQVRFIILTHNFEFMNLLMRNNIINQNIFLKK